MRKLKLDLDDLTVEAFETVKSRAAEGTVMGHAKTVEQCDPVEHLSYLVSACPVDCYTYNGFYSECCSAGGCTPTYDYTCGDACTQVY